MNPRVPRILAISDRKHLGLPLDDWLANLIANGVDALQLREKDLPDRELLDLARGVRRTLDRLSRDSAKPFTLLVNGRVDIALASGADGVHLPAAGLPVEALRRRFGTALIIGVSTHQLEEVDQARRGGADYVTFGPVFPTPSKAAYGPPPGLTGLRAACDRSLPVIALGGLSPDRVAQVRAHGASGFAGIRLFQNPDLLSQLPVSQNTEGGKG